MFHRLPLEYRRAVLAAGKKLPRLKPGANFAPPVKEPRSLALQYTRRLLTFVDAMDAALGPILDKWLPAIAASTPMQRKADADTADLITRMIEEVTHALGIVLSDAATQRAATEIASSVSSFNAEQIRAQASRVLGLDIPLADDAASRQIAMFVKNNASLIKTLGDREIMRVRTIVQTGAAKGQPVGAMRQAIQDATRATRSQAALIARDQTLKLNGQLTALRHQELGIRKYKWSTSRDERVRPMHAALEGTIHAYDDPPVTNKDGDRNNPGEDYQCRCTASPDFSDLLGP